MPAVSKKQPPAAVPTAVPASPAAQAPQEPLAVLLHRSRESRAQGGVPCDVCGRLATRYVRCDAVGCASYRCEADAAGLVANYEQMGLRVTSERTVSAKRAMLTETQQALHDPFFSFR